MRNIQKHQESKRARLDLTLTCQVLTDCQSIHSLTRKASTVRGLRGIRERENTEVKVNQISSFQPTKLKNWMLETRHSFERTAHVYGVQSEQHPAERG